MIGHVQIYGSIVRNLSLDHSRFYAECWILGLTSLLIQLQLLPLATHIVWLCVCIYTLINLELAEFRNYRLGDYSYSGHVIYCSVFECEYAISGESDLQIDNPSSDRLPLIHPLQQSDQVSLRHLLNEVGFLRFICEKDKMYQDSCLMVV